MLSTRTAVFLAISTGVALELAVHAISGRREAWDSEYYWMLGLPIAVLISIAIGFLSRRSGWLAALLIVPSQVMTMMLRSGEVGGLWPLTVVLSSILGAPFLFAAFVGSRFRRTQ
jgi:NAD/NADP transhydrogenase beta subunit